jgi:hypothetical protein
MDQIIYMRGFGLSAVLGVRNIDVTFLFGVIIL